MSLLMLWTSPLKTISIEILPKIMMDYFVVRDVQKVKQSFWNSFGRACQGIALPPASTIPDFLTPEKVLQVRAKLQIQEAKLIAKIFEPIDKEGRAFWQDETKVNHFMSSTGFHVETNDER